MPTYVHLVNYTEEGVESIDEGPDRMTRVEQAAQALGGELKDIYLTFGQYDVVGITEFSSDETAAQFVLTAMSMGGSRSETLKAFTEDQFRNIVEGLPE